MATEPRSPRTAAQPVAIWLITCATCSASGWLLTAVGGVRPAGYCLLLATAVFVAWRYRTSWVPRFPRVAALRQMARGVNRGGANRTIYALLVIAALAGGVVYAPNNYDALTYRLPRLFHWLADGRWSWLATSNPRMNYSGTGMEWLMAPLVALTHSDRPLFIINLCAFLLLPGLIFSVYSELGVPRRVAAAWRWIVPTSYCFAMQAGGISNDAYAAVFSLAAVHFAFRARRLGRACDAWLALLAMALLTGVKASNLPLALPAIVALWPCRSLFRTHWHGTLAVGLICALVSFLPTAIANQTYSGSWTGDPRNLDRLRPATATSAIIGNVIQVAAQAVQPPIAPAAGALRTRIEAVLPPRIDAAVRRDFPRFAPAIGELPQEEAAGLGIGVTSLLLVSLFAAVGQAVKKRGQRVLPHGGPRARWRDAGRWVVIATWGAAGVFFAKLGSEASARLLAPYYPLLIVPLLVPAANEALTRSRIWRGFAAFACATSVVGVLLSPSRPLVPARRLFDFLAKSGRGEAQVARAREVYAVYGRRHDLLVPVVAHLPMDERRVGLIAGPDDPEASLWLPCCDRRFEHLVVPGDTAFGSQFKWVVGSSTALGQRYGTLKTWLALTGRDLVAVETIKAKASSPPKDWFVARLR